MSDNEKDSQNEGNSTESKSNVERLYGSIGKNDIKTFRKNLKPEKVSSKSSSITPQLKKKLKPYREIIISALDNGATRNGLLVYFNEHFGTSFSMPTFLRLFDIEPKRSKNEKETSDQNANQNINTEKNDKTISTDSETNGNTEQPITMNQSIGNVNVDGITGEGQ